MVGVDLRWVCWHSACANFPVFHWLCRSLHQAGPVPRQQKTEEKEVEHKEKHVEPVLQWVLLLRSPLWADSGSLLMPIRGASPPPAWLHGPVSVLLLVHHYSLHVLAGWFSVQWWCNLKTNMAMRLVENKIMAVECKQQHHTAAIMCIQLW